MTKKLWQQELESDQSSSGKCLCWRGTNQRMGVSSLNQKLSFITDHSFLKLHINFLRWKFGNKGMHIYQEKRREEKKDVGGGEQSTETGEGQSNNNQGRKQREEWWAWECNETQVLMGDSLCRQVSNTNRMRIHFIFNALVECSISTKLKGIRKCNIITIHNQKIGTRKKERKKKSLVAKDVLMETRQMCCKPTNCSSCNFGCN
ncbi:hypothetical protein JHK87_003516 [Glycine soja]|nr:hypothetical protein JHK87_003516 [Glycine soja]